MSHIVRSLPQYAEEASLPHCTQLLVEAHAYLVERGRRAIASLSTSGSADAWGRRLKRSTIALDGERPTLVAASGAHNLIEVINQCATLERLIDALQWAQSETGLDHLVVYRCHPTTSSQRDTSDNDLVLADASSAIRACFEVSDVSGKADSNGKEAKDLASLGLLPNKNGQLRERSTDCRCFLVVSSGFAQFITTRRRKQARPFDYRLVHNAGGASAADDATHILELVPVSQDLAGALQPVSTSARA